MSEYLVITAGLLLAAAGLDLLGVFSWLLDAVVGFHRRLDLSLSLPL